MIVNHYSVLMLFMSGLGLAMAGVLEGTALWAAWRIHGSQDQQQSSAAERSIHLATLVAVVCLAISMLGWPLLYAMLDSFVPEIPGAMCIYGVTKVMPATATLIQAAKPAVIFVLGAWLLLEHVRRRSGLPPRRSGRVAALAAVAALVAFVHGVELYYVFNMDSLNEVSCCSRYGEAAGLKLRAASYYLPWALPGPARCIVLNGLFFVGLPVLALWLLLRSRSRKLRRGGFGLAEDAMLLAISVGLGLATLLEFSEVLAPLLMRLPFHHCLYCLVTNGRVPDSPLIVGNLGIGIFAAGWTAVLGSALQMGPPVPEALPLYRRVCVVGAVTLSATVFMVIIHLAVPRF